MQQSIFATSNKTKFYKRDGWQGETIVEALGKTWRIHTCKRYNGVISTHCKVVEVSGIDGECITISFGMLSDKDPKEDFTLNVTRAICTEKTVIEIHNKSLLEMDSKLIAGELPDGSSDYKIEIGQVVFSHGHYGEHKRAIYNIEKTSFGTKYHTVLLDGTKTQIDSHIRPATKLHGIGVYYNEGEFTEQFDIDKLLIEAKINMEEEAEINEGLQVEKNKKAAERALFLSQFKKADKRTTTEILKRHIYNTFPSVSKVNVTSDSFSMGDSIRVNYEAPEEIKELNDLIRSLEYGSVDSMQDMYVESEGDKEVIIDGYILESYKYATHAYSHSKAIRATVAANEAVIPMAGDRAKIVYNEKQGGVEIHFTHKPEQEVIDDIKRSGFRWSKFNKCWYRKVSPSAIATAKKYGTIPEALQKAA